MRLALAGAMALAVFASDEQVRLRVSSAVQPLVPADSLTAWSEAGLDIPTGRTQCGSTVLASTYDNGATDAGSALSTLINACGTNTYLLLGAGEFLTNTRVRITASNVTLRGSGVGTTFLRKTNQESTQAPNVQIMPNDFPSPSESTDTLLSADAVKGSYTATLTDATGFSAGQLVILDEDGWNHTTWDWTQQRMDEAELSLAPYSDRLMWPVRCFVSGGGCVHGGNPYADDPADFVAGFLPIPSGLSWFSRSGRPIAETKEIASVDGNVVTFTTPIHITYRAAQEAQLTRFTGTPAFVAGVVVEDLTATNGSDGCIKINGAARSWVKNVDLAMCGNPGVGVSNAMKIEIRDSLIHDQINNTPGGAGYLISLSNAASEVLIENNVVVGGNKVMVARSAGAGSVVGYNFMDNSFIAYDLNWQEVGINGSHQMGGHHILFEGNYSPNYDSDNSWGSAIYMTAFRNHLSGNTRDFAAAGTLKRAIGFSDGAYWHNFLGNVLGASGAMSGWVYEDPGDGTYGSASALWGGKAIWRRGMAGGFARYPDETARARSVRDGNFDYVSNSVVWTRTPQTLPDSLYLSGKPAFFAAEDTWPWVNALGATKLYTLPAKVRGEALLATATVPPQLTGVVATVTGATTVNVNWVTPNTFNWQAGIGVTATCGARTGVSYSVGGSVNVTGLTTGVEVTCTVVATNAAGNSTVSAPSNAVTPS